MPDIKARLKKVIWRSLDNDFTIAAFILEKVGPEFIATGDLFKPSEGITYSLSGEWQDNPKYGKQFKINAYSIETPCDSFGIAAYLEKYVKGVGPVLADKLIEKYGDNTIKILKGAPERVEEEIEGISYELALRISNQLKEDDLRQEILIKLEGLLSKTKGLPKNLAGDLLNNYGLSAFEAVIANPYVLTGMNRVGFVLADRVAMANGTKKDDPERIKAGIFYVIKQMMQETGDVWIRPNNITDGLLSLISGTTTDKINMMIAELTVKENLTSYKEYVTLPNYSEDENTITDCVGRFLI